MLEYRQRSRSAKGSISNTRTCYKGCYFFNKRQPQTATRTTTTSTTTTRARSRMDHRYDCSLQVHDLCSKRRQIEIFSDGGGYTLSFVFLSDSNSVVVGLARIVVDRLGKIDTIVQRLVRTRLRSKLERLRRTIFGILYLDGICRLDGKTQHRWCAVVGWNQSLFTR